MQLKFMLKKYGEDLFISCIFLLVGILWVTIPELYYPSYAFLLGSEALIGLTIIKFSYNKSDKENVK